MTLACLALALASAAAPPMPTGRLIENVACREHPDLTYSLFLPTSWRPSAPAAILYVFDARGHGAAAAAVFASEAERLGWIVASSNATASDGPEAPSVAAIRALWSDTHARFDLDPRRTYFAGFSGMARLATRMAALAPGAVAGVIGCGAGFASDPSAPPPFLYFGTVGTEDFNHSEMLGLRERLAGLQARFRIVEFDGGHRWPPAPVAAQAMEWLEAAGMRLGAQARDGTFLCRAFEARLAEAASRESAGRLRTACLAYRAAREDFAGLVDVGEAAAGASRTCAAPAARRAEEEERQAEAREARIRRGFPEFLDRLASGEATPSAALLRDLDVPELDRLAGAPPDEALGHMAHRLLSEILVQLAVYLPQEFFGRKQPEAALRCLALATVVRPHEPLVWVELARGQARAGAPADAVASLRRAVREGWTGAPDLPGNADFASLRGRPDFAALLASPPTPLRP